MSETRPSSLPPGCALPQRQFLRETGRVDLPVLFNEFRRRITQEPNRDLSEIACGLNYEIIAEQMLRGRA